MNSDDARYFGVLLEEIRDQNKAVLEYVGQVPDMADRLKRVEEDVTELKQDVKVVKAAVTDLSQVQHDHERRVAHLEAA